MNRLSRRGVMGGVAVLIPTMAGMAAVEAPVHPDTELIAACARFCEIEALVRVAMLAADHAPLDSPEAARHDAEADRLHEQQAPHLAAVLALPCITLDGVEALATALAEWDQDLFNTRTADIGDMLTARLVRNVLALRGAA